MVYYTFFFFSVITHTYGREGRDKKDYKALMFDFEFFQNLAENQFIANIKKSVQQFITLLNNSKSSG